MSSIDYNSSRNNYIANTNTDENVYCIVLNIVEGKISFNDYIFNFLY